MKLYSFPISPNGKRVRVCAGELGLPLDVTNLDFQKGEQRAPSYLALNPMGKVPTVSDGDFALWESAAILCHLAAERPGIRLLVVGGGQLRVPVPAGLEDNVTFLGRVDDAEKAQALRSADVYVAPNTGGESFGIVLVEAMAAGATVVASDIPAFRKVLGEGRFGVLFRNRNVADLTSRVAAVLDDPDRSAAVRAEARTAVRRYDWSAVAGRILAVYETVVGATPAVEEHHPKSGEAP